MPTYTVCLISAPKPCGGFLGLVGRHMPQKVKIGLGGSL